MKRQVNQVARQREVAILSKGLQSPRLWQQVGNARLQSLTWEVLTYLGLRPMASTVTVLDPKAIVRERNWGIYWPIAHSNRRTSARGFWFVRVGALLRLLLYQRLCDSYGPHIYMGRNRQLQVMKAALSRKSRLAWSMAVPKLIEKGVPGWCSLPTDTCSWAAQGKLTG